MMERIYKALIPDDIEKDIVKSSYAKNLVGACIISFFASSAFAIFYLFQNFQEGTYALMLNEIVLLSPIFIIKYYRSLVVATTVYIFSVMFILTWLTWNLGGGIYASTAYWFALPPLVAAYIGGMRQGYFWSVISIVIVTLFFIFHKVDHSFPMAAVDDPLLLTYMGIVGLNLVILSLVQFYESNTKRNLAKLQLMAYRDVLTDLPNRIAYQEMLDKRISESQRNKTSFTIIYINIDNFEKINSIFGHIVGDDLLIEIPRRIKRYMPYARQMARIDGDEFKIILESECDEATIREIGDFFLATIRIPYHIHDHEIKITASLGIATYHPDMPDNAYIDRFVELALIKAKKIGGNNYQYFNEELAKESALQIAIEKSLPQAIANNELNLNFQLIFNAKDHHKICGFEVLLRWQSPTLGSISPSIFIPIAEKIDMISQLDDWVLREACKVYRAWQLEGLVDESIPMSTNISPQQLYDVNFLDEIKQTLSESGVEPQNIILELTETAIITDQERAISILKRLHEMGIRTVIDDFGVGYTSLSYLTILPVSGLKIDKYFIDLLFDKMNHYDVIVRSIIDLAHQLNLKVVSEGVESIEQLNYLKEANCDSLQGFYLKKPLDVVAMKNFLKQYKKEQA